jgi:hypothetical protein
MLHQMSIEIADLYKQETWSSEPCGEHGFITQLVCLHKSYLLSSRKYKYLYRLTSYRLTLVFLPPTAIEIRSIGHQLHKSYKGDAPAEILRRKITPKEYRRSKPPYRKYGECIGFIFRCELLNHTIK